MQTKVPTLEELRQAEAEAWEKRQRILDTRNAMDAKGGNEKITKAREMLADAEDKFQSAQAQLEEAEKELEQLLQIEIGDNNAEKAFEEADSEWHEAKIALMKAS